MADITQLSDDELREIHSSQSIQSLSDDELLALAGPQVAQQRPPIQRDGQVLKPAYPQPPEMDPDLGRAVAQGATFGYSDELGALAGGEDVESRRASYEEIPVSTRVLGELLGGTLTTVATGGLAAAAPGAANVAQIAAKVPGWLKASGLAGAYGALYGSGTAEEGERLEGAKSGGTTGAVLGAVGYPVIKAAQYLGTEALGGGLWGAARKRWQAPGASAAAKVGQSIARDEMSAQRVAQRLKSLGPQATIADAGGPNVQGLARHTGSVPGPAQNRAQMLLNQRSEQEAVRVNRAIAQGLDPEDYYAAEEGFLNNLRTRAKPLYDEAYEKFQTVMSKPLFKLLESKTGKKAFQEALDLADTEGIPLDAAALKSGKISLQMWDDIKRGFDSLLDKPAYRNELTGRLNTKGHAVDGMRRRLLSELDQATGGVSGVYARARATYAGDAEVLGALKEGRKALNMDPELITKRLEDLSEAGQEAFRSGVARALKDNVERVVDKGSVAGRIFGNAAKRQKIRAAFPDADSYRDLRKALVAEQRFAATRNKVMSGSQTAPRIAESADALTEAGKVGGVIAGTGIGSGNIRPNHPFIMASTFRKVGSALMGKAKEHDLEVARILFNRDPVANKTALDAIFTRSVWDGLPPAVQQKIGQAMLVGAGQQGASAGNAADEFLE